MSAPAVSIVLPAYNCVHFINQTIDSLLAQTLSDFELLIINDGSSDDTGQVIQSYSDHRIRYIQNDTNKGLVYTLNKGMRLAQGKYVARMDADDIALPERFELQKKWLDDHPSTAVVGCTIQFIDEQNNITGLWKEDQATTTHKTIMEKMAWENCIAHPTVMMRKAVAIKYPYNSYQQHTEDYDLWLRMLADGLVIEKVPNNLLFYRVHHSSVTGSILRKANPFFKQFHCKRKFLHARIKEGKWGAFESNVLMATIHDGIMGMGKNVKQKLKAG